MSLTVCEYDKLLKNIFSHNIAMIIVDSTKYNLTMIQVYRIAIVIEYYVCIELTYCYFSSCSKQNKMLSYSWSSESHNYMYRKIYTPATKGFYTMLPGKRVAFYMYSLCQLIILFSYLTIMKYILCISICDEKTENLVARFHFMLHMIAIYSTSIFIYLSQPGLIRYTHTFPCETDLLNSFIDYAQHNVQRNRCLFCQVILYYPYSPAGIMMYVLCKMICEKKAENRMATRFHFLLHKKATYFVPIFVYFIMPGLNCLSHLFAFVDLLISNFNGIQQHVIHNWYLLYQVILRYTYLTIYSMFKMGAFCMMVCDMKAENLMARYHHTLHVKSSCYINIHVYQYFGLIMPRFNCLRHIFLGEKDLSLLFNAPFVILMIFMSWDLQCLHMRQLVGKQSISIFCITIKQHTIISVERNVMTDEFFVTTTPTHLYSSCKPCTNKTDILCFVKYVYLCTKNKRIEFTIFAFAKLYLLISCIIVDIFMTFAHETNHCIIENICLGIFTIVAVHPFYDG